MRFCDMLLGLYFIVHLLEKNSTNYLKTLPKDQQSSVRFLLWICHTENGIVHLRLFDLQRLLHGFRVRVEIEDAFLPPVDAFLTFQSAFEEIVSNGYFEEFEDRPQCVTDVSDQLLVEDDVSRSGEIVQPVEVRLLPNSKLILDELMPVWKLR